MSLGKGSGLCACGSQCGQRLAGVIGDVHRIARPLAEQLRRQPRIDTIIGPAFAREDQFRIVLQERQLDRQKIWHIDMHAVGDAEEKRKPPDPCQHHKQKRRNQPSRGDSRNAAARKNICKDGRSASHAAVQARTGFADNRF